MLRRLTWFVSVASVCLAAPQAFAQDAGEAPPAHISFVDGAAVLERDGKSDNSPTSMPLLAGDRIRTQSGRVEVLFADGSALHVDDHTVVDFQSDEVLRLLEGRLRLNIAGQGRGVGYRIDAPSAWVQISDAGEYRVAVIRGEREPQIELAVLRGAAELVNEDGRSLVRAGERAFAQAGARPSAPYVFNSAAWDAFDRWSESRRDQRLGASAEYLPSDVRPYSATFDHYGSWRYEPVHGYVWYPRVDYDWRPYYHGRWVSLRPYGWTWIAGDPWGWPTHHYGRWGFSAGAWFWIPRPRWGAAWVSWGYAPGYVSWCPLGWNDRPVFSFLNINIFGGRRYDHWRAWTVIPQRHFGHGFVRANVVGGSRLDHRVRGSFVFRDRGPDGYSGSRASIPIRAVGVRTGYAVPRGSAFGAGSRAEAPGAPDGGTRAFPSPARQPRTPGGVSGSAGRSTAPITSAPPRAVTRDRGVTADAPGRIGAGESRSRGERFSPRRESDSARRPAESATVPPPESRAVPRQERRVDQQPSSDGSGGGWGRYDRTPDRPARRDAPEYRPDSGTRTAPSRSPDNDGYRREGYRAVPRQDAPRPSSEAPRAEPPRSYERPRHEAPRYEAPRPERSAPRGESPQPRSYGAPERRAPSGDGGSRTGSSGDGGQSRSRGGQAPSGRARPRGQ